MLSLEVQIVQRVAYEAGERLTRKLIRNLQHADAGLLGAEGARNLWEEICIQVRRESALLELYEIELTSRLEALLVDLTWIERVSIWLCTYGGEVFAGRLENNRLDALLEAVAEDEIVRHVLHEHVDCEAQNYTNGRIRRLTGE
jgi:hypothetical protein